MPAPPARAIEHRTASRWPASEGRDSVTLDYDARHRRRIRLATDGGEEVLLDLPRAAAMADGDGLRLDDGRWLRVRAAPEALVEIRAADAVALARIAWSLGNRHLPAEIREGIIRIRPDPVIEAMVLGLGAAAAPVVAPFQPVGGAYDGTGGGPDHHRPE